MGRELTDKQKRFADEYLIDMNASAAYRRVGYKSKNPDVDAHQLLVKPSIQAYIRERMQKKEDETIAKQDEVLKYLTTVMRGEIEEECIAVESIGDYQTRATTINKQVSPKDRNKAAELLAKRYGLLTDNVNHSGNIGVTIVDDIK